MSDELKDVLRVLKTTARDISRHRVMDCENLAMLNRAVATLQRYIDLQPQTPEAGIAEGLEALGRIKNGYTHPVDWVKEDSLLSDLILVRQKLTRPAMVEIDLDGMMKYSDLRDCKGRQSYVAGFNDALHRIKQDHGKIYREEK